MNVVCEVSFSASNINIELLLLPHNGFFVALRKCTQHLLGMLMRASDLSSGLSSLLCVSRNRKEAIN